MQCPQYAEQRRVLWEESQYCCRWARPLLCAFSNFAFDRLSRYAATLWRQAGRIIYALELLNRRKPQERNRRFHVGGRLELPVYGRDDIL